MRSDQPLDHRDAVRRTLAASPAATLFMTELRALTGLQDRELESAVADLQLDGRIVVQTHNNPDPHLVGDWRTVSLVTDEGMSAHAVEAAFKYFDQWLKGFLQHHRCG